MSLDKERLKMKRSKGRKIILATSVALLTLIVYLPSLQNAFVQRDDGSYIFENPHIRSIDLAFFKWAFFDFYAANWHPLTWIAHAFDYELWGLTPLGHHLTSVLLHAFNTFLVVFLVMKILEAFKARPTNNGLSSFIDEKTTLIAAGVTGLLFGLHPVHVESVAWASEKKDLLCASFFLLSLLMYVTLLRDEDSELVSSNIFAPYIHKSYLAALGFFILALLSKPMAVSLPVVMLILDWFPLARIRSVKTFFSACIEKSPFFILSVVSSVLTIIAQKTGLSMALTYTVPMSSRVLVAAKSLAVYLINILWPVNLLAFYPYPKDVSLLSMKYIFAIALFVGITIVCLVIQKKQKFWLVAWGYYVITLIPVLGIVQVGGQSMADRYTYLPALGPFLVMGIAAAWLWKKINSFMRWSLIAKTVSISFAFLILLSLSYLTVKQIGVWKNDVSLWTNVIDNSPEPILQAFTSRSMAFFSLGQFNQAIGDFTSIISLDPRSFPAYFYRGLSFYKTGQFEKAITDFTHASMLTRNNPGIFISRGLAYNNINRPELALQDFKTACGMGDNFSCKLVQDYVKRNRP
jgi:protein O-mannosyl-transferase